MRTFRIGCLPFSEQTPSAPNIECELPRGRKAEGLRNKGEEFGTGPDSWRTDAMGLGGGRSAELTLKPSSQWPISSGRKAFSLEEGES